MIDFDKDSRLAVQMATAVRQLRNAGSTVIAVSEKSDPALILDAMRAGCTEFLSKPLAVGDLSKAFGHHPRSIAGYGRSQVIGTSPGLPGMSGRGGNYDACRSSRDIHG